MAIFAPRRFLTIRQMSKDSSAQFAVVVIVSFASIISSSFGCVVVIQLNLSDYFALVVIFPEGKRPFQRFPVGIIKHRTTYNQLVPFNCPLHLSSPLHRHNRQ